MSEYSGALAKTQTDYNGISKVTSFCQRLIRSVKCLNQDITGKIHSFLYATNVNITMAKKGTPHLTSHECTLSSLCRRPLVRLYTSTEPLLEPEEYTITLVQSIVII